MSDAPAGPNVTMEFASGRSIKSGLTQDTVASRRLLATVDVDPALLRAMSEQGAKIEIIADLSCIARAEAVAILWALPSTAIGAAFAEGRDPAPVVRDWQNRAKTLLDLHRVNPDGCVLIAAARLEAGDAASLALHRFQAGGGAGLQSTGVRSAADPLAVLLAMGVLASDRATYDTLAALDDASHGLAQSAPLTQAASHYAALLDSASAASLMREQLLLQQLAFSDAEGASVNAAPGRLARVTAELHQMFAELRQERSRRKQAEEQRDRAVMRHAQTAETLAAVLSSRSWRITRPLRALSMRLLRASPPVDEGKDAPRDESR